MRITSFGHLVFALALIGFGVLNIAYHDFALQWQPVPGWVPDRAALAYLSGAVLILCGAGVLFRRTAVLAAGVIVAYLFLWIVVLQLPLSVAHPAHVGAWLPPCENLGWFSAALALYAAVAEKGQAVTRLAQVLFAIACIEYGLSHFVYADITASMVPAWLPGRLGFAYLTGAGHFAAGVALLVLVVPRLAATLEAAMMTSFVLLVHIPGVIAAPADRFQWTMLAAASILACAGWMIACTFAGQGWGFAARKTAAA